MFDIVASVAVVVVLFIFLTGSAAMNYTLRWLVFRFLARMVFSVRIRSVSVFLLPRVRLKEVADCKGIRLDFTGRLGFNQSLLQNLPQRW